MNEQNPQKAILLFSKAQNNNTPANGATEPALKKKPLAALLDQTYGEANAKTAGKSVIFTPQK